MRSKKKKISIIVFCFFVAFVTLLLFSKCSFLYPFNGWDDFNSFYTVGSSWANGLIPYRDLFEQKGPFLYLIFMIGYLISPGNFNGIFILEVIFFTVSLYFSSKIIDLFIDKKRDTKGKYLILLLYALMLTTSMAFVEGGSSEEFNLPFVTISVYYIIKYLKKGDLVNISYKELIISGLCCGLSLMIKYTTIGLWFIFMAYVCINLIRLKRYKEAILKGLVFIISMISPLLIFSIYFYMKDSLFDFLNAYFYINIFKYSSDKNIFLSILTTISNMFSGIFSNTIVVGMLYFIFCYFLYKKAKFNKNIIISKRYIILLCMILFSMFVMYYGQLFRVYAIIAFYFIFLLIIIYFYKLFSKFKCFKFICVIYIIISVILGIDYEYMMSSKDDVVQYRFANIINEYDNPTLLHYRSIDEGFYTAAGILPINKYFEQVNINVMELPESYDEQDNIIRNKEVMFVVLRKFNFDRDNQLFDFTRKQKELFNLRASLDFVSSYYDLIDVYENEVGYYDTCTYYLFKVKE